MKNYDDNEYLKFVGNKLKEFRIAAGMSRTELSYKSDVATSTIYNIESGDTYANMKIFLRLCKTLHISFQDILPVLDNQ